SGSRFPSRCEDALEIPRRHDLRSGRPRPGERRDREAARDRAPGKPAGDREDQSPPDHGRRRHRRIPPSRRTRAAPDRETRGPVWLTSPAPASPSSPDPRQRYPDIALSVSATTRPPRPGELDGIHYHFLSAEEFADLVSNGEFLEYAKVHGRYHYGTLRGPVEELLEKGVHVILEIDL